MADRRCCPRFVLSTPVAVDAMSIQGASVEEHADDRLVVLGSSSPMPDEAVLVHVTTADGVVSYWATVISSSPVCVAGTVRFRMELRLGEARAPQRSRRQNSLPMKRVGCGAVLMRPQQVHVRDVSRTGCRLSGSPPLDPGAMGMLIANIEGQLHVEYFRVSRVGEAQDDPGRHEIGVEFLLIPANTPTMHDFAAYLEQSHG